ncbi:MAG: orotidine-5'-phosphate decarboxylase [Ignavibacteria bacterium]|nr:orotidine-5'-phosphate decarboxylase [Ignavibacteria bacterium]
MNFNSKLIKAQKNSLLCVGLDTDQTKLPIHLRKNKNGIILFNKAIINSTKDFVCAYKINLAFYESLGKEGWHILKQTLKAIPKNIITIGDGKRGDIGNTASQYAKSLFNDFGFDAVTVNPYMGYDSVEPFLNYKNKGIFLLAVTSNKGAYDFQFLKVGKLPLYKQVVKTSLRWNKNNNIGFVVGATKSSQLKELRKLAPKSPFLIPGVGAQGGNLRDAVKHGSTIKNNFAIINVSRSVLYASSGKDFAIAARKETIKLAVEILKYRM